MPKWTTGTGPTDGSGARVRQVVAFNVRRARLDRGLTQQELGEHLEAATGTKWSRATVSHAEAGWGPAPGRVRHFDVNEVAALALILAVPIPYFFLPPPVRPTGAPVVSDSDCWISPRESDHEVAVSLATLAAMVVPDRSEMAEDLFYARLVEELPQFLPRGDSGRRALRFKNELTRLLATYDDETAE